jgi:hypothetical protein
MRIVRINKNFAIVSGEFYSKKKVGDIGLSYFEEGRITEVNKRGFRDSDGKPAVFLTAKIPIKNFIENMNISLSDDELKSHGLL